MPPLASFPRRRTLVVGFLAALVPLLVLLALQYVWLSRLAGATAIAHRAALRHFVEAAAGDVRLFYQSLAHRALSVPASTLTAGNLKADAAAFWSDQPSEGIARLFLVDYTRDLYGNFYVLNGETGEVEPPYASDESLAMIAASNPWQMLRHRGRTGEPGVLRVDERDPSYRIVLLPVTDQDSAILGVAGMILDEEFFRRTLLPRTVENLSGYFFPGGEEAAFAVTLEDDARRVRWSSVDAAASPEPGESAEGVSAELAFVFSGWTLSLEGLGRSPEDLARESFLFNLSLAGLLALLLLAGLFLALRAASRAVDLSEMKSDFVSNVSHELRTPVSSIRVFGEFLRTGRAKDEDTVRKYGRHIEAEGRRLTRLIDNVLDFSRIESGHKEYEFVDASLEDVVETAVETFRARLGEAGFEIAYDPPSPPLPRTRMDPDAMGQVLHNLLDNAIKYSGNARRVDVVLERDGEEAVCSVRDLGVGIPPADRDRIFDRFHRVGQGLVHDVKGTGLGLSIVAHVVRAHRGQVAVESAPGEGTIVRVRLPLNGAGMAEPS